MANSPLWRLPAEIRLEIYELVLTQPEAITICDGGSKSELGRATQAILSRAQAIANTCRQIREECGNMLFACNDFTIQCDIYGAKALLMEHFLPRISVANNTALTLVLNAPPNHLHMRKLQGYDFSGVPISLSRSLLNALSMYLHEFQLQHAKMSVTLSFPVVLSGWHDAGDCWMDAVVDFKDPMFSITKLMEDLHELNDQGIIQDTSRTTIKTALCRWRDEGFVTLARPAYEGR